MATRHQYMQNLRHGTHLRHCDAVAAAAAAGGAGVDVEAAVDVDFDDTDAQVAA